MIHTLEFEVEFDFQVIGLSCHAKDYRMAWMLNKELALDFSREEEIEIPQKNGTSAHSCYHCDLDEGRIHLYLMRNRSENGYFMAEIPQVDYLLKVEGAEESEFQELIQSVRGMDQVIYTLQISPEKYKSGVNLLF